MFVERLASIDSLSFVDVCLFVFQSNTKKVDACVETVSIGLATEPDQLGPCEPVRSSRCLVNDFVSRFRVQVSF